MCYEATVNGRTGHVVLRPESIVTLNLHLILCITLMSIFTRKVENCLITELSLIEMSHARRWRRRGTPLRTAVTWSMSWDDTTNSIPWPPDTKEHLVGYRNWKAAESTFGNTSTTSKASKVKWWNFELCPIVWSLPDTGVHDCTLSHLSWLIHSPVIVRDTSVTIRQPDPAVVCMSDNNEYLYSSDECECLPLNSNPDQHSLFCVSGNFLEVLSEYQTWITKTQRISFTWQNDMNFLLWLTCYVSESSPSPDTSAHSQWSSFSHHWQDECSCSCARLIVSESCTELNWCVPRHPPESQPRKDKEEILRNKWTSWHIWKIFICELLCIKTSNKYLPLRGSGHLNICWFPCLSWGMNQQMLFSEWSSLSPILIWNKQMKHEV